MKCPICGQELKQGKKDPNYLLCYNCKKKFKVPQKTIEKNDDEDEEEQRYSNIPPKQVRKKREEEMRRAYDEMLAVKRAIIAKLMQGKATTFDAEQEKEEKDETSGRDRRRL